MKTSFRLVILSLVFLFFVSSPFESLTKAGSGEEKGPEPTIIMVQVIIVPYCSLPPECITKPVEVSNPPAQKPVDPLRQKVAGLTKRELTDEEIDTVLIIASLIEKEGKDSFDKPIISAIIWNRLKKGMRLQLDVAPDTYKQAGLPSAKITEPGLESIEAALNPAKTDSLFFMHDRTGQIRYTAKFSEHLENVKKYLKF